jgi:starch-binding outer membrane protein, SusD/RagB family
MKNHIKTLGIVLLTFSSCGDFLDVPPETTVTPSNFFKSKEDFEQALTAIYAPLQDLYESDWILNEMHSDNTHFIFDVANRGSVAIEDVSTFLVGPENGTVENKWRNNYLIISRANQVLSTIDGISFDQASKDNMKGQALFLRAFAYFDLVKNFGPVPIYLQPVSSFDETFQPRVAVSEVYQQILADARQAADLLPNRAGQSPGKATAGAANTLLGDVYINLKQWEEAKTALLKVTGMGYGLLPVYADIFKPSNEGNAEIIFEVEYLEGTPLGLGSEFPYRMIPPLKNPALITGLGSSPAMPQGLGGWNIPTPDLIAAYEDTTLDKRYGASIAYITAATSAVANPNHVRIPYVRKYQHPHAIFRETDQNWVVYRYAEVLLMLAEVLNEQGKAGDALPYLNQVRQRAGLQQITTANPAELRDMILREQRIELAFENKRWATLVRKGLAVNVMNSYGARVKDQPQRYYYAPGNAPFPASFNITEDKLVYPIPLREILVNPNLDQNPGY